MGPGRWTRGTRGLAVALALVLGSVACFLTRAFGIDDPLFVWLGRHLAEHPLDVYGFEVNWYGVAMPMHTVTMNPPLAGYYVALAGSVLGYSEPALHTAFLLPAGLACAGTWRLAEALGSRPLVAVLAGLMTPAFLVAATSVMCDVWMLVGFTWAVVQWRRGLLEGSSPRLFAAGALAAAAVLTKYFALALVPLLLAHGWALRRRPGRWMLPLLLPIAAAVAFELATRARYGQGLVSGAGAYAALVRAETRGAGLASIASTGTPAVASGLVGLAFAGGCFATTALVAPLALGPRTALALAAATALGALVLPAPHRLLGLDPGALALGAGWFDLQAWVLILGGLALVALAVRDLARRRDPDALLLFLWVLGTLVFATGLNWSNNGRSNLPLAPAAGILLARGLASSEARSRRPRLRARVAAAGLFAGAALALLVARGDAVWADQARRAARELAATPVPEGRAVRFQGHWGFHYYAEQAGAEALDPSRHVLRRGDVVLRPRYTGQGFDLPATHAELERTATWPVDSVAHTMTAGSGACFHASSLAPMPFTLGPAGPERYEVWRVTRRFGWKRE